MPCGTLSHNLPSNSNSNSNHNSDSYSYSQQHKQNRHERAAVGGPETLSCHTGVVAVSYAGGLMHAGIAVLR